MFDSHLPYLLLSKKIQEDPSFHKKTTFYRIKPVGGPYIIEAEEYINDTFILKYYPSKFKRHPKKYHLITGSNVMNVVMGTGLKIFQEIYQKNPGASFGYVATPSIVNENIELKENNQRFRIYTQTMQNYFGNETFAHFADVANSAYLMVNRNNEIYRYIGEMQVKFSTMYPGIFDLNFSEL